MPTELSLSLSAVFAFVLVLARVSGALIFVPLPGIRSGPEMARILLALSFTIALFPNWPHIEASGVTMGHLVGWMLSEAALGLTIGLAVAFLTEAFLMATQIIGLQAGYGYASTIDPTTQADSSILQVFAQLTAGLLFFAMGLDREILRVFARSLESYPPGAWIPTRAAAEAIIHLGAGMFSIGLRLALPAVALLVLVDLALALLGRINSQLQLLTLAFPVKMLAALGVLVSMAALFPTMFRAYVGSSFQTIHMLIRR